MQTLITYTSTISSDNNGPLDLIAEINFNDTMTNAPIMVVMHGFSTTSGIGDVEANAKHLRDKGFFAITVALRGWAGSDGVRNSGGTEIYDIYDAVEFVKQNFESFIDTTHISITGYSGGGGNTMSALTRFPDYFRVGAGFYGMSDYGYHTTNGYPTANQQDAVENWFIERLLNSTIPAPVLNQSDSLFLIGFVKTKAFSLWLGDGQNASGDLYYMLSATEKQFTHSLLSNNKSGLQDSSTYV